MRASTNNSVPSLIRPQAATASIPNTTQQNKPQHYQPNKSQGNRHNDLLNQGNPLNSVIIFPTCQYLITLNI